MAVESIARPAAYRWVRGPAIRAPDDGRTDWFTGGADRATRVLARFPEDTAGASAPSITPRSYRCIPRSPLRGACFWPPSAAADQKVRAPSARSLPCCGSLQQFGRFGGERIGPQRDRPGCSREPRQAVAVSLGARAFWPAFRKTPLARQRRPHPTVVPSHPACFWPPSAAADQKVRAPSARSLPCCGSLQQFGRFGGERIGPQRDRLGCSREPRQAGAVSLGARAFWPAFRKTPPARQRRPYPTVVPSHPACFWPPSAAADQKVRAPSARSLPCCGSLQQFGRFGGERIGPQRDRPGCSRKHRQAVAVSLGARAFWPAFRKTQPARQRRPHPTVVPLHAAVVPLHAAVAASRRVFLAAFGGSGPEGPRTQRAVVALLWFSTAVWQVRWGAHRPAARSSRLQ